ncbi:MFS transporter [Agrobacterium sp. TS43]|uniref:MFS transporter n=1 Tax=Agrobacterium TaxID=357 RepID=UPI000376F97E|nr:MULTISPECIES: MFS transporter [Agrobacterium]EPR15694.1 MFS transporter [Agrobacterium radiobacter DSM 30147]KDR89381.1 MFS transporter [Agrobacterium tumefaciens GW4]KVK51159.1 MFS transporter [Agrobacterium sp. LY4]KVK55687.1 MFS transporter [Agrobacterium sp. TS43]KVK67883.1 MFS transporter [Agrobacterium sp. C13]
MSSQISSTSPTPAADRRIWAVLAVAVATQTAGSFVSQGIYILVPFWREAFGISLASASLAVTVMNGVQIVTMFTLGRAIDIHGERRIVGIAMLGMALAMACAAAFANSLPALLLCIAFLGGTYAAVQPGGTRAIMRWFPPAKRGIATGFRQAAVPFGTMIAAALLPFMAVRYGWHAAAWLCAGVSVMGAALFWGLYREGGDVAAKTERPLPLAKLAREVGQNPSFWPVLRLGIAMSAFQFTLTAHVIGFMADGLRLGLFAASSMFAATQLAGIPGRILLPWLSDRFRPGLRTQSFGLVSVIAAGAAAILAALPIGAPTPIILVVLVVLGIFGIGWFPLYLLQIAESAPKGSIASTIAFASTICLGVMAIGPYIFGLLVDHLGYGAAWSALIVPVAATALPLAISSPRLPKAQIGSS